MTRRQCDLKQLAIENIIVAGLVFFAAVLPRTLLPSAGTSQIAVLWPAAGVGLAAALLLGWRITPGIFLPFALSGLLADFPWVYGVLSPLGLCVAVMACALLLRKAGFDPGLKSIKDIVSLAFGSVTLMGAAGFWSANCLLLAGKLSPAGLGTVSVFFASAYAGGAMVVTPALLLIASGRLSPSRIGSQNLKLGVAQLGLVLLSTWIVFSSGDNQPAGLSLAAYLPFPFVLWAALSGGMAMGSLAILCATFFAAYYTGSGLGPFAGEGALGGILQLQAFIGILSATGLLIGSGTESLWRERRLQSEAAVRKAELERLKAQVNPHFLFNCLTAIHSLIRTDGMAAEEGLTSLSSLLRKSLDVAKHPLIPLGEELEIIRETLRLQKMRFEEGLEWSVAADNEAETFRVPPMLLQPLVENAVKHGVCDGFGRVDVTAVVNAGDLLVKVRNTAPEGCDPAGWGESVGLASVRARVEESCPTGSGVEFSKTLDGWIQALVRIKPVV